MPDRAGFEAFYGAHLPRIVRACTLVLLDRGEAEDVAAEAFARLWSHWGQMHGEDHAGGYVFKTAMRQCSKRRRRAGREVVGAVPDRGAPAPDTGASASVTEALKELPPSEAGGRAARLGGTRDDRGRKDPRHEGEHGAGAPLGGALHSGKRSRGRNGNDERRS